MRATRPSPARAALIAASCLALARGARPAALAAQAVPAPAPPAAGVAPAGADSAGGERGGWLFGASVGVPGYEGEAVPELFTVGVHWTQLRPGRPGVDLAIGTMPRVLAEGFAAVGARAGVALPLALSRGAVLLPSAGVSLLGGVGAGGGGGTTGLNAGVAAVLGPAGGAGLRTGVTWHRFGEAGGGLWLVEVGVVRWPRR